MDTYSSRRSVDKGPSRFESDADLEAFIERCSWPRVRMSVEGFDPYRPEDEIERELINHFESCGEVFRVIVPRDPIVDRRAFVILLGHGAEEKALQLSGSDIGDWNALVKFAPEEEEEEYKMASRYEKSLSDAVLNDRKLFGIVVFGYDTSLPTDEVERSLTEHFSSCGEITHVYVCPLDEHTNIYFSQEKGEARALDLNGSEVGGFRITTMRVATVRSNPPLAPGETRIGYSVPAHMIEFAPEIGRKVKAFKRMKRTLKKFAALRKARKENFSVFMKEMRRRRRRIRSQKD